MQIPNANPRRGHGHPWWMMLLCTMCLLPLAIVAAAALSAGGTIGLGGLTIAALLPFAVYLLCPLLMGGMMFLLFRTRDGSSHSCHEHASRDARANLAPPMSSAPSEPTGPRA